MESNEDITLRPFSELTLKDVTPYLRELIQEEMSNCLVNKKLPPAFSGIKDSTIEHFLTNPELYTIGLKGLADLLHCSIKSAYNYKRSGKYDPAIHKIGKRFVINKEIALDSAFIVFAYDSLYSGKAQCGTGYSQGTWCDKEV